MQLAAAHYLLSPMLFKKKQQSRFQFAQSLDPMKTAVFSGLDWDEIEVPAKIQDLIERNIRTLSNNSLQQNKSATGLMSSPNVNAVAGGGTAPAERLDFKDMKEIWLTKKEML